MHHLADFIFEAQMLQRIKRTGYQFLGVGDESVAEHTFTTIIIAWTMAQLEPKIKEDHLILMCIMHDIPETRMGDLNYIQQEYVKKNEEAAINEISNTLPFGSKIKLLINEFNAKTTLEAKFANDADQLSFIVNLKCLAETGYTYSLKWIDNIESRLVTPIGMKLLNQIRSRKSDSWWQKIFIDKNKAKLR